jgi:30S ribosomal protein 3
MQNWSDTNVDWFTSSAEEKISLPDYRLTFLWQEKNIAVAVDQVYSRVGPCSVDTT